MCRSQEYFHPFQRFRSSEACDGSDVSHHAWNEPQSANAWQRTGWTQWWEGQGWQGLLSLHTVIIHSTFACLKPKLKPKPFVIGLLDSWTSSYWLHYWFGHCRTLMMMMVILPLRLILWYISVLSLSCMRRQDLLKLSRKRRMRRSPWRLRLWRPRKSFRLFWNEMTCENKMPFVLCFKLESWNKQHVTHVKTRCRLFLIETWIVKQTHHIRNLARIKITP